MSLDRNMPPCASKSANNPLEIDTKMIPLEQFHIALRILRVMVNSPLFPVELKPGTP